MGRAPDTLNNAPAWMARAGCRFDDTDVFFDERNAGMAKSTCRYCPVRRQCLDWILGIEGKVSADLRWGVYGGMTSKERGEKYGPGRANGRPPAECGTPAAYQRHVKKGESIDDDCRRAHTDARRKYRTLR
jgi:WhiB family redox-sensing transcriptional regulator